MGTVLGSHRYFRFGIFELNLAAGELRKGGVKIKLQDQPFRLLAYLVQHPGEVVTREELRAALWPADTFVDFENSLNATMAKLRQALGDTSSNPRFVETLPKRGYRFIYPVERDDGAPEAVAERVVAAKRSVWQGHHGLIGLISLVAIAGVVAAWVWFGGLFRLGASPTPIRLTSYPGAELAPSFSPDGRQVAFMWKGDIYVKLTDPSGTPVQVTSDSGYELVPRWSPDGRWIAFLRSAGEEGRKVMLAVSLGGQEREVLTMPWTILSGVRGVQEQPNGIAWTPDGKWLAVSYRTSPEEPWALFLVSIETGEKLRLTSPERPRPEDPVMVLGDFDPAFSFDGRRLVFVRLLKHVLTYESELHVLPVSADGRPAGKSRRLEQAKPAYKRRPVWTGDGDGIVAEGWDENRNATMWRIDASDSKASQRIPFAAAHSQDPAICRQGHLAYSHLERRSALVRQSIYQLDLKSAPRKVVDSPAGDSGAAYTPDGRTLAFSSVRSGSWEIWLCDDDGSHARQLTKLGERGAGQPGWVRWSPDGESLAFAIVQDGKESVWVMSASGGAPKKLGTGMAPTWSRDGRWIYFSKIANGRPEIFRMPVEAGEAGAVQVTRTGGARAVESRDGKYLYYVPWPSRSMMKMPLPAGEEVLAFAQVADPWSFDVTDRGIYFFRWGNARTGFPLIFFDFRTGQKKPIHTVTGYQPRSLSVSPDGRSVLYSQRDEAGRPDDSTLPDLMLVKNFR